MQFVGNDAADATWACCKNLKRTKPASALFLLLVVVYLTCYSGASPAKFCCLVVNALAASCLASNPAVFHLVVLIYQYCERWYTSLPACLRDLYYIFYKGCLISFVAIIKLLLVVVMLNIFLAPSNLVILRIRHLQLRGFSSCYTWLLRLVYISIIASTASAVNTNYP